MIFIFERIPRNKSASDSLISSFNKKKITVEDARQIDKLEIKKNEFYAIFEKLFSDKNFLPTQEVMASGFEYLFLTIDLQEIAQKANYSLIQNYTPFITNKEPLDFSQDNTSVALVEYIFARYVFSLGTIRSLKKPIQIQMKQITEQGNHQADDFKETKNIFTKAFVRLVKLYRNKALIWAS